MSAYTRERVLALIEWPYVVMHQEGYKCAGCRIVVSDLTGPYSLERGQHGPKCPVAQRNAALRAFADLLEPWQTMETAPMDGTAILLVNEFGQMRVANRTAMGWAFYRSRPGAPTAVMLNPTHWMPLPAAPVTRPEEPTR